MEEGEGIEPPHAGTTSIHQFSRLAPYRSANPPRESGGGCEIRTHGSLRIILGWSPATMFLMAKKYAHICQNFMRDAVSKLE